MSRLVAFIFMVAGVGIGVLITTQFIVPVPLESTHPYEVYEAQQELISTYTEEQGILKNQITNLREQIEDLQAQNAYFIPEEDREKLNQIKEDLGLTELTGPGIEIVLQDSPSVNRPELDVNDDALIHAADVRDLLNLLHSSDVHGVAVNNQRIAFNSTGNCVGNTILINNFNMLPPFTLLVLTDNPEEILIKLADEELLFDLYRRSEDHGIVFKFRERESITLPVYTGNFRADFLTVVEE